MTEARTVANLEHSHIVPVYDVGNNEDYPCYIVTKYIAGIDLSQKLKLQRLTITESAALVATVADALHYAHKQGLVHRDVKPGNILLDTEGKPYVVDFGLALREENIGKGPRNAGTPMYMSPEQARGEGHRVDGRSDIFSLGVMLYEMLVGRRPFEAKTQKELLQQITTMDARPLRQIDDTISKEMERICLKAISKRSRNRYTTAVDFADDLRHFLSQQPASSQIEPPAAGLATPTGSDSTKIGTDSNTPKLDSDSQPIRIVPKGLRSFDAHDADFFLELLPGPRDRDGLPDNLRFWKTRIEETDADDTFSIGLIYGPSGCGKSSLVKAGLLPRLNEDVISVYVEATPDETETRLLQGLRKRCPGLEDNLNLKETMAALRRGQGISVGKKVLIVLDQFEQWLHAKEEDNPDLVRALRQCDGGRVQCVVMVRDDFWLAISRFLSELETQLVDGLNIALVDLFNLDHARKVLAAFGRSFGRIPDNAKDYSKEQQDFLEQSANGVATNGKVISVRLALFAEMMKDKPWTMATLKKVGGTEGLGVTFLEDAFSSSTASPEHRYHQKAARAVLSSLLPENTTNLKGQMRSERELFHASGYANRPKDFEKLIRLLDRETRLITPTDPEGDEFEDDSISHIQAGKRYYQLTHDYLVPSLKEWLTLKQKETRRGRAQLMLAERAALWDSNRENRFLPSMFEYAEWLTLTDKKKWTSRQWTMMNKAKAVAGVRLAVFIFLALFVWSVGLYATNASQKKLRVAIEANAKLRVRAVMEELERILETRTVGWEQYCRSGLVQETLRESNLEFAGKFSPQPLLDERDLIWKSGDAEASDALVKPLLTNELARDLKNWTSKLEESSGYPVFGEVFFTNRYGGNAAQTGRTSDYRQDDEAWWQRAVSEGVYIGDIEFDGSANIQSIEICLRVDDDDGDMIGVMKAVLNLEEVIRVIERPSRSSRQTTRVSPSRDNSLQAVSPGRSSLAPDNLSQNKCSLLTPCCNSASV